MQTLLRRICFPPAGVRMCGGGSSGPVNHAGRHQGGKKKRSHKRKSASLFMTTRSGELRTQKLRPPLLRTQSSKVPPLKSGVDQCIAVYATPTGRKFLLISTFPGHSLSFFFL